VFLGVKAEMLLDIKENKITISTFMNELAWWYMHSKHNRGKHEITNEGRLVIQDVTQWTVAKKSVHTRIESTMEGQDSNFHLRCRFPQIKARSST
jgi:hypothetical protein